MSSTKSPISSGPTNAGTRNSSMAQKSWRLLLYFRMIWFWQMGEIAVQCRLAWFVISQSYGLKASLKWIKMEFERQYDKFRGKRGVSPWKEEGLMSCVGWAMGVRMVIKECRMKLKAADQGPGATMGIEEHLFSRAAHPGWEGPKEEGGKESGIKLRRSQSRLRRGLKSAHCTGGA